MLIVAAVGLAAFLTLTVLLVPFCTQAFNPVAALTAAMVAVIGIAWFKKTCR